MQRADFLKLVGGKSEMADYVPVACMLKNGYACAGYYNQTVNDQYAETCVLVNARMVDLREPQRRTEKAAIHDFGEFLEQFVVGVMEKKPKSKKRVDEETESFPEQFGKSIPLTAISFDEIAIVYPVARIGNLLRQANEQAKSNPTEVPSFLDFQNKSVVVKALMTKLW